MPDLAEKESGLVFIEKSHEYFLNGVKLPSVTEILKPLSSYTDAIPDAVMEKARDRGTKVHVATELYDLGTLDLDNLHPVLRPYLDAWIRFREETGFQPKLSEFRVYSAIYGYAGTLDRTGVLDGQCVLDIKARAQMTPDTGPQTAAYQRALEELTDEPHPGRYGVLLLPTGKYKLTTYKDRGDFKTFLSCLNVHNFRQKHIGD